MRTLIVGHGGRESALASRMAEHSELHAFVGHLNPTIVRHAERLRRQRTSVGDVCDADAVAAFAREREIDIAMVSADEPLAAGVVDALLAQGTRAVGPTRAGAEIEWNKAFARALLAEVAPEAAPLLRVVARRAARSTRRSRRSARRPVAVKPSGLTGGKGVKVMGPHLAEPRRGARLRAQPARRRQGRASSVLIEEKIVGAEFTIQAISDGQHRRVPALHLRLPVPLRRRRGPGHRRDGLAVDSRRATLPFMTDRALRGRRARSSSA